MQKEGIRNTLWRWSAALDTCCHKQLEIQRLKQLSIDILDCGTPLLTGMPKVKSIGNKVELAVETIIDTYEATILKLTKDIEAEMNFKASMEAIIDQLSIDQKKIIMLRYRERCGWRVIPQKMNYSRRQCFRTHDEALKNLALNGTYLVL